MSDLRDQTEPVGIFRELARTCWAKAHEEGEAWAQASAECPPARVPTLADMAAWTADGATEAARAEAAERLTALVPPDWQDARGKGAGAMISPTHLLGEPAPAGPWHVVPDRVDLAEAARYMLVTGLTRPSMATVGAPSLDLYGRLVADAHRRWLGGPHPLAPLVDAWQRRPSLETWTERQYRNVPAPLAATDHVVPAQDDRPGADHLLFDWDALHAAPPDQPRFEVAYLPTLDPDADSLLPLAMLDLFTSAASRGYGGPVPVPARIGWEVVLALDSAARRGGPAQLNCTLADLHQMVYPATPRWQKRHGPDLVRGLFNLDVARVRWRGDATGGLYPLVEVYRLPSQPDKAEPVVFLSHLPPGSQQGPQADSDLLRHLAAASARQHRMMLSGYCLFDRYGTVNGRLIAPTLPVVQRNAAGYVLDARDKVIAERGAPTRRATHRRAVQTGARETNPEADRYPWLADRDLILLGYPFVAATPSALRNQRRRVHEAVVALRDRSALDFKAEYRTPKHGGKPELVALRLLPSAAHVEAHAARWAARKHNRSGA